MISDSVHYIQGMSTTLASRATPLCSCASRLKPGATLIEKKNGRIWYNEVSLERMRSPWEF